jgi:molybdopterin molybdotransferase
VVRLKGFQELTPVDTALATFLNALKPNRLAAQLIPLGCALGRVTADAVIAQGDLPPFSRSAVDGYAVKANDTVEATRFKPRTLRLVQGDPIQAGEAKEVWTGGRIPKGADSVVMLEYVEKRGTKVMVSRSLAPGINVSKRGEDVKKRGIVVEAGQKLTPYHLGLLAAMGAERVRVVRKPRVAILATGDELVAVGEAPKPHSVVEVNSIILSGMCREVGAEGYSLGITRDDEREIDAMVRKGLAEADMVIITGGTSVGIHDLVPETMAKIAPTGVVVHGIAMRPGMPTALAVVDGKPVFILSGNPVAAAVAFEVFARPLILRLLGAQDQGRARLKAKLTRPAVGVLGRRVFLRVRAFDSGGEFHVAPVAVKGSGIITTLTKANGYVVIPEDREGLAAGEVVTVHLLDSIGV